MHVKMRIRLFSLMPSEDVEERLADGVFHAPEIVRHAPGSADDLFIKPGAGMTRLLRSIICPMAAGILSADIYRNTSISQKVFMDNRI